MRTTKSTIIAALCGAAILATAAQAANPVPTAILNFNERGITVRGYADKISDLLFAYLAAEDNLWLVDRQDLNRLPVTD